MILTWQSLTNSTKLVVHVLKGLSRTFECTRNMSMLRLQQKERSAQPVISAGGTGLIYSRTKLLVLIALHAHLTQQLLPRRKLPNPAFSPFNWTKPSIASHLAAELLVT